MDRFRKEYRPLKESNSKLIKDIKEAAERMAELMALAKGNREMSLAFTKLEEASMWASKSIVIEDERDSTHE